MLCASSEVVEFVTVYDFTELISRSFSEALLIEVNFAWSAVHDSALSAARSSSEALLIIVIFAGSVVCDFAVSVSRSFFKALSIIVIFAGSAVHDFTLLTARSSFRALLTVVIFVWSLRVLIDNVLSDLSDCLSSCFILKNVLLMKGSVMFLFKLIDMSLKDCPEACSSDVS